MLRNAFLRFAFPATALPLAFASPQMPLERVSVGTAGEPGAGYSFDASITPDARFVAFESDASNLIAGDIGLTDVFVRDRLMGRTERVSVNSDEQRANNDCQGASLSDDGRRVEFASAATNLALPAPTSPWSLIYVRDRAAGTTEMVSLGIGGAIPDYPVYQARISGDGNFVVYESWATNIVAGDTNGTKDIFVRSLPGGATVRASLASSGAQPTLDCELATISADGRFVCFQSDDATLVANDTNAARDVFLRDLIAGTTTRVSVNQFGAEALFGAQAPWISADGRTAAFQSFDNVFDPLDINGFVQDVFVKDLVSGATSIASVDSFLQVGDQSSWNPRLSRDGRFVAFESQANLGIGQPDPNLFHVYLRDRTTGTTTRVSILPSLVEPDDFCERPSVSADGRTTVFDSRATTLFAPPDPNGFADVVAARAPLPAQASTYCTAKTNSLGCVPEVVSLGFPSASDPQAFYVGARKLVSHRSGLGLFGFAPASAPFHGGILCVQPPLTRLLVTTTGGTSSAIDCSGTLTYEFNSLIQSGFHAGLVIGADVRVQFWYRDPPSPGFVGLSDALLFTIQN